VAAVYSPETGRLEQLTLERDDNGSIEARAYMAGTQFDRIEIDTDGDGKPDRWEYYSTSKPPSGAPTGAAAAANLIVRAEQATRGDGAVSRWEYYEGGVITRVEEDTRGDGRIDKWERYTDGDLTSIDLDLGGRGKPDRRILFRADGSTEAQPLP